MNPTTSGTAHRHARLGARLEGIFFQLGKGVVPLTAAVFLYVCVVWAVYLRAPSFVDHIEPSMTMQALVFANGGPVYLPADAADRTSLIYGPLPYLLHSILIGRIADPITATKTTGILMSALSLLWVFLTYRGLRTFRQAAALLLYVLLAYLCFSNVSFWNRPDSFILAGIAFCIHAGSFALDPRHPDNLTRQNSWRAWLVGAGVGAGLAFAFNSKVHAVLYGVPIAYWYFRESRWKLVLPAAVAFCVVAALPFGLYPDRVVLRTYLTWVGVAATHPWSATIFLSNFVLFLKFLGPIVVVAILNWGRHPRLWIESVGILGACGIGVCLLGSKIGAGPPHILPLALPISFLAWQGLRLSQPISRTTTAWALLLAVTLASVWFLGNRAFQNQRYLLTVLTSDRYVSRTAAAVEELRAIMRDYPDATLTIGYSETNESDQTYQLTYLRPFLFSRGKINFIDSAALMDMESAGMPLPAATVRKLSSRTIDIFVVPRQGRPFVEPNFYNGHDLFTPEFRRAFEENYSKKEERQFFAIWAVKPAR